MSSHANSCGHRSRCLVKLQTMSQHLARAGAKSCCKTGKTLPHQQGGSTDTKTDQEGGNPEQIQLQEPLGLGTLLSTMEHPRTSILAQPKRHKDTHSQLFSN